MSIFTVIETPHDDTGSAKTVAQFATRNEALSFAAKSTATNLSDLVSLFSTARELLALWQSSGKGYRIEPDDAGAPYSDIDFSRLYALRLTNDYSHPVFIEVSTIDCLRTASGVISPSKTWQFWVKAPSTYEVEGIDRMINVATEYLYDDMSRQSMAADGSSYVLSKVSFRAVSEDEALDRIKADPNATIYFVQNDGSFGKNMPINPMAAAFS